MRVLLSTLPETIKSVGTEAHFPSHTHSEVPSVARQTTRFIRGLFATEGFYPVFSAFVGTRCLEAILLWALWAFRGLEGFPLRAVSRDTSGLFAV